MTRIRSDNWHALFSVRLLICKVTSQETCKISCKVTCKVTLMVSRKIKQLSYPKGDLRGDPQVDQQGDPQDLPTCIKYWPFAPLALLPIFVYMIINFVLTISNTQLDISGFTMLIYDDDLSLLFTKSLLWIYLLYNVLY